MRIRFLLVAWSTCCLFGAIYAQIPEKEEENPYARKPRKAAVSAELGMNSLASLYGIKGTFFVKPQFAIDLGLGLSTVGLRPGFHARYLFSQAKFTGFVYGGLKYGLGSGGQEIETEDPEDHSPIAFEIFPSPFMDLGVGIDFLAHNGFYFTGTLGWSYLLKAKNFEWTRVAPNEKTKDAFKVIFGSGPALALSLGYAF